MKYPENLGTQSQGHDSSVLHLMKLTNTAHGAGGWGGGGEDCFRSHAAVNHYETAEVPVQEASRESSQEQSPEARGGEANGAALGNVLWWNEVFSGSLLTSFCSLRDQQTAV